jgi:hypothetical protein
MFIKVTNKNNSKPSNVYLVEGYRDESGKSKQRTIKKYGKLSKLQKNDPNILKKREIEANKKTHK